MTHWETSLRLASTGMFRGWASSWLPSTCVSSLCSASSVCAKLRSIQNNNTHWTLFHIGVNAGDMVYISWIKLNLVHLFFFNMTQFDLTYLPGETVGYTSECECQRHCWQEELPPSLCSRCACCKCDLIPSLNTSLLLRCKYIRVIDTSPEHKYVPGDGQNTYILIRHIIWWKYIPINDRWPGKSMFPCAGYGRREAVEILLNAGANVHARDDGDWHKIRFKYPCKRWWRL